MKRISLLAKPKVLVLTSLISINLSLFSQSVTLTKSFQLDSPGHLEMETSGGDITIEGVDSEDVEISVTVKKYEKVILADDPLMEKFYNYYDLKIEKVADENKIVASAKRIGKSDDWHYILGVSFHIKMPQSTSNKIHVNSGNIRVSNQMGSHKYTTSGGNIFLDNISGTSMMVTSGGNVEMTNNKGSSEIRISGGELFMNSSEGNIDAITSGGEVSLDDINGKVHVRSSGGHVSVNGHSNSVNVVNNGGITANITGLEEDLYLNTTGGNIKVNILGQPGINLDLKAEMVNLELPKNFNGSQKDSYVVGSVNGGGIPVKVQATGGEIDFFLK